MMKKRLLALLICLVMTFTAVGAMAEVLLIGSTIYSGWYISEANFPDPVIREFLESLCKNDQNFLRDAVEIQNLKKIDVSKKSGASDSWRKGNIVSLQGIGKLTNVTQLYCGGNKIANLDVSGRPNLVQLLASENQLTSIDLSNNLKLEWLGLDNNQLETLDMSANTALTAINVSHNKLTSLDVSNNTALTEINCYSNSLKTLDVSRNTKLDHLDCDNNQLKTLDVSKNTEMKDLSCWANKLKTLDVSKNTKLTSLDCSVNQITVLDVSACPNLANMVQNYPRQHNSDENLDYFTDGVTGQVLIDPWTKVIAGSTVSDATQAAPEFPAEPDEPTNPDIPTDPTDPSAPTSPSAPENNTPTVGALKYKLSGSKAVVTGPKDKNAKKLTIPDTVKANGKTYKVTEIKANAFKGMKKLTAVTIGANVKTIGKSAFQNCAKLKTITIKTKSLTSSSVKGSAFKGIYKKATFKCPKGKADAYKKILLKKGAPKTCKFK